MAGMGNAMMGTGEAEGEGRAIRAAEDALCNPLLGELSIKVRWSRRQAIMHRVKDGRERKRGMVGAGVRSSGDWKNTI